MVLRVKLGAPFRTFSEKTILEQGTRERNIKSAWICLEIKLTNSQWKWKIQDGEYENGPFQKIELKGHDFRPV